MQKSFRSKLVSTVLIIVALSFILYAKTNGKVGQTKKNSDEGCDCHGDANNKVTVTINGPSEMKVNETAEFSVTISGGPLKTGGTNVAVSDGVLIEGPGLKLVRKELAHKEPRESKDGRVIFNFSYTSPETPGDVTMYANGNSTNNDESKKGDMWNYAPNKVIKVK